MSQTVACKSLGTLCSSPVRTCMTSSQTKRCLLKPDFQATASNSDPVPDPALQVTLTAWPGTALISALAIVQDSCSPPMSL